VERTDIWERRRLAYEIKGYTEGVYIVSYFRGLPQVEAEMKRVFGISEDTLRCLIVRPDTDVVPEPLPVRRDFRREGEQTIAPPPAPVVVEPEAVAEAAPAEEPTVTPEAEATEQDAAPEALEQAA
jgi:hypothetical protein